MRDYLNFSIQTKKDFKNWIFRQLGYPFINSELGNENLEDCINELFNYHISHKNSSIKIFKKFKNIFSKIKYDIKVFNNINEYILFLIHGIDIKHCKTCNKKLTFKQIKQKQIYCSNKCRKNNIELKEKIKQTNLKKYGTEYIFQSNLIKNKIKQTNLKKYGTEYTFQSNLIKNKIKQTNLKKYRSVKSFTK